MRVVNQAYLDELNRSHRYAHLVYLDLDLPLYLNDSAYPITYQSKTWQPHAILGLDSIEADTELRVDDISLELGNADQTLLALLQQGYMNRTVKIHGVVLDDHMQVIDADESLFEGVINYFDESERGGDARLTLYLTNELANFEAPAGRLANLSSQQLIYPTCTALRHAVNTQRPIGEWGHEDLG